MAWQAATHTGNGHALAKELFAVKRVASEHRGPGGSKSLGAGVETVRYNLRVLTSMNSLGMTDATQEP